MYECSYLVAQRVGQQPTSAEPSTPESRRPGGRVRPGRLREPTVAPSRTPHLTWWWGTRLGGTASLVWNTRILSSSIWHTRPSSLKLSRACTMKTRLTNKILRYYFFCNVYGSPTVNGCSRSTELSHNRTCARDDIMLSSHSFAMSTMSGGMGE